MNLHAKSLLVVFALFASATLSAQNAQFKQDDRSVAIIVNPVFSYVGNLFDQDTYNDLYLNSAGIVFRKFTSENRVSRFSFSLNFSERTISYGVPITTNQHTSYGLSLNFGKEYRKSFTNLSVYGGGVMGIGVSGSIQRYTYEETPQYDLTRPIEVNDGNTFSLRPGGFLGTEYYFSPHFFIGAEVRLIANLGFTANKSQTLETIEYNGAIYVSSQNTTRFDDSFFVSVQSNNAVLFYAGIRF